MTVSQGSAPEEGTPHHSEFHGPAAVQGGPHGVQNNHFHAPARAGRALPWNKVLSTLKNVVLSVVVVAGLVWGAAWWLHRHHEQQARVDATRSACRQAYRADDVYRDSTLSTHSFSEDVAPSRELARRLRLAASASSDPEIKREIQTYAGDMEAWADATERGDDADRNTATIRKMDDQNALNLDCRKVLGDDG